MSNLLLILFELYENRDDGKRECGIQEFRSAGVQECRSSGRAQADEKSAANVPEKEWVDRGDPYF
jgi:hypothetical protein